MNSRGTLLFVHAHPDDEALFTAGTSLHYAAEGYRVVLVTCTNGRLGIDDQWLGGDDPSHHSDWVRRTRASELVASTQLIGVDRTVNLGYDDSGLPGWPQNVERTSFVNANVEAAARVLAAIMDEENARVIVTYDENGYYGHPDHIRANVVTRRAMELSTSAERLFYPVTPRSVLDEFIPAATERKVFLPLWVNDAGDGYADEHVDVTIDARRDAAVKQASIRAHASQVDNADLTSMDADLFEMLFGKEFYVLAYEKNGMRVRGDDLFAGLA